MNLNHADTMIDEVASLTDSVLLMHSLSGKDSIALLDLLYPKFRRVVCCFMYVVPSSDSDFDNMVLKPASLDHNVRFVNFIRRNYPNAEIVQVPHFSVFTYVKCGYMGMPCNPKQRKWNLSDIIDSVRNRLGIEWCCLGMKMTDGMNRRLMLRNYRMNGICDATKKFYPLAEYTSKQVLAYIRGRNLISPEGYDGKTQSAGESVIDYNFLKYLQLNYPKDLERIYAVYPRTRFIIGETEGTIKPTIKGLENG